MKSEKVKSAYGDLGRLEEVGGDGWGGKKDPNLNLLWTITAGSKQGEGGKGGGEG